MRYFTQRYEDGHETLEAKMHGLTVQFILGLAVVQLPSLARSSDLAVLLDRYAANADQVRSWRMAYQGMREADSIRYPDQVYVSHYVCDFFCDGDRVFHRERRWGGVEGTNRFAPDDNAHYRSTLWDGKVFSNYAARVKNMKGVLVLDENPKDDALSALRCKKMASPLFGYYYNAYQRVDTILRGAREISLREAMEPVNGVDCYVIEAETEYGHYTIWVDPEHGYNFAKVRIHISSAKGHRFRGKAFESREAEYKLDVLRFGILKGAWIPMEGTWDYSSLGVPGARKITSKTCVVVREFVLEPDHEALGSFIREDVVDGTTGVIMPHPQIERIWQDGSFVPKVDEHIVRLIDKMVTSLLEDQREHPGLIPVSDQDSLGAPVSSDANDELNTSVGAQSRQPGDKGSGYTGNENRKAVRPHCGLYCLYVILSLNGKQLSFRDLVKPEYLGYRDGSSLDELHRLAVDHGMEAKQVARLSTRGLRSSPHSAVLHVRSHPGAPEYDHYEIFLGVEKGKAKLCNPPESPRLVSFKDLAPLWDGRAIFLSPHSVDIATILRAERQRWLVYGMIGVALIVVAHFGRRIWLAVVGQIPQRWSLGLTVGQAVMIGLAALLCGGGYHFFHDEGLLANATATADIQKGHVADFIPKVSEKSVRKLLGGEAVLIDARYTRDYRQGHLRDAINLPIDANESLWNTAVDKIPEGQPIVVYCQSAGCKFAENVSVKLIEHGYTNISIYKGGWVEWTEKHNEDETTEKEVTKNDGR